MSELGIKELNVRELFAQELTALEFGQDLDIIDFDDLLDSPLWDSYPPGDPSSNWSIKGGEYTLEGSTTPDQVLRYRSFDFLDGSISATVLNPFSTNISTDMILSMRIVDAGQFVGVRVNQNGIIVSEVAGSYTNLLTVPPNEYSYPVDIKLTANGASLILEVDGVVKGTVITTHTVSGVVGIVARANTSDVPLAVFTNLRVATKVSRLLYGLTPTTALKQVASRAPGTIYYWDGNKFADETDNTKMPFVGKNASTEIKTIAGYDVPIYRRDWTPGDNASQGDIYWHQNPSGDTRLVHLVSASATLAESWTLQHAENYGHDAVDSGGNTWRSGVPYVPEYGVLAEPETTQLAANPANVDIDLSSWTSNVNITRISAGNPSVIEGFTSVEYNNAGGANALIRPNSQVTFTTGVRMTWLVIIQRISGAVTFRLQAAVSPPAAFLTINFATGEVAITDSSGVAPSVQVRWIGNETVAVWFSLTPVTTRNSYFYLYPADTTAELQHFRVHYNGWANVNWQFQPIVSASTRPADARIEYGIGSRQTFWIDQLLDHEFKSVCLAGNALGTTQRNFFAVRTGYLSVHCVGSLTQIRCQPESGLFAEISNPNSVGNLTLGAELKDSALTLELSKNAGSVVSNQVAYEPGTNTFVNSPTDPVEWNFKATTITTDGQNVIRAVAIWNDISLFDFDTELGQGIHQGQPLPPAP